MEIETALRNLATMLKHRGCDTTELEALNVPEKQTEFYTSTITVNVPMNDDPRHITVFFCLTRDLLRAHISDLKKLEDIEQFMNEYDGSNKFIMVFKPLDKPSQNNMMAAFDEWDKTLLHSRGYFQTFKIQNLMYDPAAHVYVPEHKKIDETEIKQLLDKYQLKNRFHLPNILRTDVMARYLGLNHGDVVKILRYNDTAGTYTYYRCCIKT